MASVRLWPPILPPSRPTPTRRTPAPSAPGGSGRGLSEMAARSLALVFSFFVEGTGRRIQRDHTVFTGLIVGFFDGRHDERKRFVIGF